jgi:hypothetical protein
MIGPYSHYIFGYFTFPLFFYWIKLYDNLKGLRAIAYLSKTEESRFRKPGDGTIGLLSA